MTPTEHNLAIIANFVKHCIHELNLKKDINIKLVIGHSKEFPSAGCFEPNKNIVYCAIHNRAVADVLRTLAHELTHKKQHESGVIFPDDDESLQVYEDEANTMSGRLVRFYGRKNKEIYWDLV